MFKRLAIAFTVVLTVLLAVFFGVAVFLPSTWSVAAGTTIAAPPEVVYPYVAQLRHWPEWTTWNDKAYPSMKHTFEGTDGAAGSKMSWTANNSPSGLLTITALEPPRVVRYKLFFEGMGIPATGSITLEPVDGATRVTWHDQGDVGWSLIARYFVLFVDSTIEPQFEQGLATLKQIVETNAHK